jgi:upstream activation factor subunit UAF30
MLRSDGIDESTRMRAPLLHASAELAAIVGDAPLSRAEAVSRIWDYIRANGLQNPNDKRQIIADPALSRIFGSDRVTMFDIERHVISHLR